MKRKEGRGEKLKRGRSDPLVNVGYSPKMLTSPELVNSACLLRLAQEEEDARHDRVLEAQRYDEQSRKIQQSWLDLAGTRPRKK